MTPDTTAYMIAGFSRYPGGDWSLRDFTLCEKFQR